jgi:hypothetical protein
MTWAGHVERMEDRCIQGFGRKTLGRPKCRWEVNTKMNLRKIGWGVCAKFIWLKIETSGELLLTR